MFGRSSSICVSCILIMRSSGSCCWGIIACGCSQERRGGLLALAQCPCWKWLCLARRWPRGSSQWFCCRKIPKPKQKEDCTGEREDSMQCASGQRILQRRQHSVYRELSFCSIQRWKAQAGDSTLHNWLHVESHALAGRPGLNMSIETKELFIIIQKHNKGARTA